MQKRRGGASNSSDNKNGVLPMTEADVARAATSSSTRRVRKRRVKKRRGKSFLIAGPQFWSLVVVLVMSLLGVFVVKSFLGRTASSVQEPSIIQDAPAVKRKLPLSKFSSLKFALENAELVALYFAASWCPMSTPVTQLLDETFSNKQGTLLQPNSFSTSKMPLAIVYVSSDDSEKEMLEYSKTEWINVPFDSDDRNNIKKHYQVCAKKELPELGIERKFEIPSLFVIDGLTHGIISTNGVKDLETEGDNVLTHWQELQQVIRGLEDKYIDDK